MAGRPEFLDMSEAVGRLSAKAPEPFDDDADELEDGDDPYSDYDEDDRLLLGAEPRRSETVTMTLADGSRVEVPVSEVQRFAAPEPARHETPMPYHTPQNQHQQRLQALDQEINALARDLTPPKMPSAALAREDPDEYTAQFAVYQAENAEYQERRRQYDAKTAERGTVVTEMQTSLIQEQQNLLAQRWPEWGDPAKRAQISPKLKSYAQSQGYSAEEAALIADGKADHRLVLSLRNAMRQEILTNKPKKGRRDRTAPKVGTPGAKETAGRKRSGRRSEFLRFASERGVSRQQAANFLAGKYSQ